ncbi:MAG: hypothetical protein ABI894_10030 [Ilumatobacteraceae bacterium]
MRQNPSSPARSLWSTQVFRGCIAGFVLASLVALSACGDDGGGSASSATAPHDSFTPEDIKVAPAVVTAGLTRLPATIASAIAAIGTPDAEVKLDAIEQEWATFEGTVRETDPDIYLAIEDQLAPVQDQIKAGDTDAATATLTTMTDLFDQYLTQYPG